MKHSTGNVAVLASLAVISMVGFAAVCQAAPITIVLSGHVTTVYDDDNVLGGNGIVVNVDDLITASYKYESTTPNTSPSSTVGTYQHDIAPFGMTATAGDLTMQTDPANVNFLVQILNDNGAVPYDNYLLRSYENTHNIPIVLEYTHMSWSLQGKTLATLDSTALPTVPLDLDDWNQASFSLTGDLPQSFGVYGVITSVTPEPATLSLLALGGLAVLRRKRR